MPNTVQYIDLLNNVSNNTIIDGSCQVILVDLMPRLVPEGCTGDIAVVRAARVSYGNDDKDLSISATRNLIRYLMRHNHMSPFEMGKLTFRIKCPIFVARQLFRHRMANYNERSGRYTAFNEEFYTPPKEEVCFQSLSNHQGGDLAMPPEQACSFLIDLERSYSKDFEIYSQAIDNGVSKELARLALPVGTLTEFYVCMDLRNFLHMAGLRMDPHTQLLTRKIATAMYDMCKQVFPLSCEAFQDYYLNSVVLTGPEIRALLSARLLSVEKLDGADIENKREREEFIEKTKKLGILSFHESFPAVSSLLKVFGENVHLNTAEELLNDISNNRSVEKKGTSK